MKDLYYEITEDGYHIYDRNDSLFHIHQYEPYIPNRNLSYEENAKAQIHEFMIGEYVSEITSHRINIKDVPEEYQKEVKTIVDNINNEPQKVGTDELETAYKEGVNSI